MSETTADEHGVVGNDADVALDEALKRIGATAAKDRAAIRKGIDRRSSRALREFVKAGELAVAAHLIDTMPHDAPVHHAAHLSVGKLAFVLASDRAGEAAALIDAIRANDVDGDTLYEAGKVLEEASRMSDAADIFAAALARGAGERAAERLLRIADKEQRPHDVVAALEAAATHGWASLVTVDRVLPLLRPASAMQLSDIMLDFVHAQVGADGTAGLLADLEYLRRGRRGQVVERAETPPHRLDLDALTQVVKGYVDADMVGNAVAALASAPAHMRVQPLFDALAATSLGAAQARLLLDKLCEGRAAIPAQRADFALSLLEPIVQTSAFDVSQAALDEVLASAAGWDRDTKRLSLPKVSAIMQALLGRAFDAGDLTRFAVLLGRAAAIFLPANLLSALDVVDFDRVALWIYHKSGMLRPQDGTDPRRVILQEQYQRFFVERWGKPEPAETSDFGLCRSVAQFVGRARLDERPNRLIAQGVIDRLTSPRLSVSGTESVSLITLYELLRERPRWQEDGNLRLDALSSWSTDGPMRRYPVYLVPSEMAGLEARGVPDSCDPRSFISRYLHRIWQGSEFYRTTYAIDDPLGRFFLIVDLTINLGAGDKMLQRFLVRELSNSANGYLATIEAFAQTLLRDATLSEQRRARLVKIGQLPRALAPPENPAPVSTRTVHVVGHVSKRTGLGRNYTMFMDAFQSSGIGVKLIDIDSLGPSSVEGIHREALAGGAPPFIIFLTNAHNVPLFCSLLHPDVLASAKMVGFLLWEMSTIPFVQEVGARLLDEVWAPTRYVADLYAPFAPVRVVRKGLRDPLPSVRGLDRPRAGTFRVVTIFDFDSSIERKNPLAAIRAFRQAFGDDPAVEMLVKVAHVNPQHWSNALWHWEALLEEVRADGRIRIIDTYMSDSEMVELIAGAGAIISTHRSEGYGYVIADALLLEVPVVATDSTGNVDFATSENSFPVRYREVPVPDAVAYMNTRNATWAEADVAHAAEQLRAIRADSAAAHAKAALGRIDVLRDYAQDGFADGIRTAIAEVAARLT